jgi:hypothetical protein
MPKTCRVKCNNSYTRDSKNGVCSFKAATDKARSLRVMSLVLKQSEKQRIRQYPLAGRNKDCVSTLAETGGFLFVDNCAATFDAENCTTPQVSVPSRSVKGARMWDLWGHMSQHQQTHCIWFPLANFEDSDMHQMSRATDMYMNCDTLIARERFKALAKILITFKCIGRGGEVKFLSYQHMFLDQVYCLLFTQCFQRKNLKTTPTAIAVEFEHPELCCFFALGLYWACDNGLVRPDNAGFTTPAQARRYSFVFQDLHDINDASVAKQLSNIIKSVVHDDLSGYYSIKSA